MKKTTLKEQVQMHEDARHFMALLVYVMRRVGLEDDDLGALRIKPATGMATSTALYSCLVKVMRLESAAERAVTVRLLPRTLKEFQPKAKRR